MSAHKIVVSVVCNRRGGCRWRCTHLLRRARRSTGPTAASGVRLPAWPRRRLHGVRTRSDDSRVRFL